MKQKNRKQQFTKSYSMPQQNTRGIPAAKEEPEDEIFIQFGEIEADIKDISEKVRQSYKENGGEAEIRNVKIYIKPEDNKAYYVVNGETEGNIELV